MEFQLDDKASFNPRFVTMVSELWDNGGKITIYPAKNPYRDKYSVFRSNISSLELVFEITIAVTSVFSSELDIVVYFLGIEVSGTCKSYSKNDAIININNLIRRIYEKYATIDALEYPIYQMLECYLAGTIYQTTLSWRNISINIGANKFTLTHNDETFIDEFECNPKYYARQLMRAMRDGTAHEIFYSGLPIRMKSARRS